MVALWLSGCGSGASSGNGSTPDPNQPFEQPHCKPGVMELVTCNCSGKPTGSQSVDTCTGTPSACDCGAPEACDLPELGCAATRVCYPSTSKCGECECKPADAGGLVNGKGIVHELSVDSAGNVALLLTAAPWIVRVSAKGAAQDVPVRSDLSWASAIWAREDGSIVVLGTVGAVIQFQRFDSSGALVGSGKWGLADPTSLGGIARRPDGDIAILAVTRSELSIGKLGADDLVSMAFSLDFKTKDPFGDAVCCGRQPTSFAIGPAGEYYMAGSYNPSNRVDGIWFAALDPQGVPVAEKFDKAYDLFESSPRIVAGPGGVYSVWTWSYTDREAVDTYTARLASSMQSVWRVVTDDKTHASVARDLAPLPDGAVLAGSQAGVPSLLRFTPDGKTIPLLQGLTTAPDFVERVGDFGLVVVDNLEDSDGQLVSSYQVQRLQLEPLKLAKKATGDSCTENTDCETSRCCHEGASAAAGVCGDATGCAYKARCSADAECSGGLCLLPAAVCTLACTKSAACPNGSYCALPCSTGDCSGACLPECLVDGTIGCHALGDWTCQMTNNTEGVQVSVCR